MPGHVDCLRLRSGWLPVPASLASRVTWYGRTNLSVRWAYAGQGYGMIQYRFPVRMDTPQDLECFMRNRAGTALDLTGYLSVTVHVKKQGDDEDVQDAQFDADPTTGRVFYNGYRFDSEGTWFAQFYAVNSTGATVHGEPVRLKVVKNLDGLGTEELLEF